LSLLLLKQRDGNDLKSDLYSFELPREENECHLQYILGEI